MNFRSIPLICLFILCINLVNGQTPQYVLEFDGTDDYVHVDSSLPAFPAGLTIEAWIYAEALPGDHWANTILSSEETDWRGIVLRAGSGGDLSFAFGDGVVWQQHYTTTDPLSLDTWHHVAATWDTDTVRLYVDGVQVLAEYENATLVASIATGLRIGDVIPSLFGSRVWEGKLDEIRLWDHPRSPAQLLADQCSTLTGSETGLVAYYNFDDGPGSATLSDLAGVYSGTLTNMDTVSAWLPDNNCLDCTPATVDFVLIDSCDSGSFYVNVMISDLGDALTVDIENDYGLPASMGVDTGSYLIGPVLLADTINITVVHDSDSLCNTEGEELYYDLCPIRTCGPDTFSYCYGNYDTVSYLYRSATADPLQITFLGGGIETSYDEIFIYDGNTRSAPLLYSGDAGGDLTGISAVSTNPGGYLLFVGESDVSNSCTSGSSCCLVEWQWEIKCTGPVSMPPFTINSPIRVFPNPSQGLIQLQNLSLSGSRISVYDLQGRLLMEEKYAGDQPDYQIDIRAFGPGLRILRVTEDERTETFKLRVY